MFLLRILIHSWMVTNFMVEENIFVVIIDKRFEEQLQ